MVNSKPIEFTPIFWKCVCGVSVCLCVSVAGPKTKALMILMFLGVAGIVPESTGKIPENYNYA